MNTHIVVKVKVKFITGMLYYYFHHRYCYANCYFKPFNRLEAPTKPNRCFSEIDQLNKIKNVSKQN